MEIKNRLFTCLALVIIISGCASNRYAVQSPASEPLSNFDGLEIKPFVSNVINDDATNIAENLPKKLKEKIEFYNSRNKQKIFDSVYLGDGPDSNPLAAECKITSFEKGSRAARYFIGYGAGKAYTSLSCLFRSKNTGEIISEASFDGELSMGVFGGSVSEASEAMLSSIIDYIQVNY